MNKNWIKKIGWISFLILFLICLYFSFERILYYDTSFHLFKIINFEKINIEANRFSTFLTQLPVLIAIKFQLPLTSLIYILSVTYLLIFFCIYLLILNISDNKFISLAFILILVANISKCFYFSSTETHQALVYSTLTFTFLFAKFKNTIFYLILIMISIALSFFSHPVAFFCIIYALGYYLIEKNKLYDGKIYFFALFALLLVIAKLLFVKDNSYEGQFFNTLFFSHESWQNPNFFSIVFLWRNIVNLYWVNIIALIILLLVLKKHEKKLSLLYNLFALLFFLIITIITYQKGDADVMMERAYMPLSFFSILPLFYELGKFDKFKKFLLYFFIIIFTISIVRISYCGLYLKKGLKSVDEVVYEAIQKNQHKIIIENRNYNTISECISPPKNQTKV